MGFARVGILGLGYVGLPLAVALAAHRPVVGFDIDAGRIAEVAAGRDRTQEVSADALAAVAASLIPTADEQSLQGCDLLIATVPTPIDAAQKPDLTALEAASRTIGRVLAPGAVVVFESTVYPGVTEGPCAAWITEESGLVAGRDYHLGYSPERVNPGDGKHGLAAITKVVAAQDAGVAQRLAALYGKVNGGNIHIAPSIRVAEAAKAIENAQRDINIAFINEVAMILRTADIPVYDVLEAARTKWNFLPFVPGLVGGHCIGVDPYYLATWAQSLGHEPVTILAGRHTNEAMAGFFADQIAAQLTPGASVLVLGASFKENIGDLRNSKAVDLIAALAAKGFAVDCFDPNAATDALTDLLGRAPLTALPPERPYDALVLAVAHREFAAWGADVVSACVPPGGLIADIKGLWRGRDLPAGRRYWTL